MATDVRPRLQELDTEERDAWMEYLGHVRAKGGELYEEIEPWAWARLRTTLTRIRRERRRLTG